MNMKILIHDDNLLIKLHTMLNWNVLLIEILLVEKHRHTVATSNDNFTIFHINHIHHNKNNGH